MIVSNKMVMSIGILLCYPLTALLLLNIGLVHQMSAISPIWLPAGMALLFYMYVKKSFWSFLAIFVASFFTSCVVVGNTPWLALGISLGGALGPFVTHTMLHTIQERSLFKRVSHATHYIVALLGGATLSALNGNLWLVLLDQMEKALLAQGLIGWLVGDFLGMLIISSAYYFYHQKDKPKPSLLFVFNTLLVLVLSYYLLTSTLLAHVEFFILIPVLMSLILHREFAIFLNGIILVVVGIYGILYPFDLSATASSFGVLHLQIFIFFIFAAGYILSSALNEGEFLLQEQEKINEETLVTFAQFIEEKDTYTAGHSSRVAGYAKAIASNMGLSHAQQQQIYKAGLIHDIGKIITPESVLLKPGGLTQAEYALMKQHASVGGEMVGKIRSFQPLAPIIRHHHEWFNGSGYPDGLRGEQIPLLARIMIIADAFDAMTTNRIYKPKKSIQEAIAELQRMEGEQFDPSILPFAIDFFKTLTTIEAYEQNVAFFADGAEAERFAYFFKDALTGLHNAIYFDTLLNSPDASQYSTLHAILFKGMNDYNHRFGWGQGDALLASFARFLESHFPNGRLFRIYGDDFIILNHDNAPIDATLLEDFAPFKNNEIGFLLKTINLHKTPIKEAKELEAHLFKEHATHHHS